MIKTTLTLIYGLLAAMASTGIVLGAISLSLVESSPHFKAVATKNQNTESSPIQEIMLNGSPSGEQVCVVPAGWLPYTTRNGDTLTTLSETYAVQIEAIKSINCLSGDNLLPGAQLHLPPFAAINKSPEEKLLTTITDPTAN